jgi:hypothetical protein
MSSLALVLGRRYGGLQASKNPSFSAHVGSFAADVSGKGNIRGGVGYPVDAGTRLLKSHHGVSPVNNVSI